MAYFGLARRAGKLSFGTESSIDTINRKKAKLVIVAKDASDRTKKNFKIICEKEKVTIRIFGTIEELSNSIGENNKAIIVVNEENFAKELLKRIDGGEIIG